jgi:hypothetical protein
MNELRKIKRLEGGDSERHYFIAEELIENLRL